MDIKELQDIEVGKIICWNFFMEGLGLGFKTHFFTVKNVENVKKPEMPDTYWTEKKEFGPAKKIILEECMKKGKFYLIVPLDWEKEKYIYFADEKDSFGDKLEPEDIDFVKL